MSDVNASPLFVNDECEPLCESIVILEKRISIESGEELLVIKVNSKGNGIPFEVSREQFTKKTIFDKLTLHGLSIIECNESYAKLRKHIDEAERQTPVTYFHESVGFRVLHGKLCFLGYRPIGDIPRQLLASRNYKMEEMLKPQGDFDAWKDFVRKHIVPNTERSLALILGATAPVSYTLKNEAEFVDVPVWTVVNSSSKGKTSLLYLIASLFGNPKQFIDTFNSTSNALYAMLEERSGYAFLCDEATHTPNIDWDAMLYTLPTGKERRRCDGKGKLKPLVQFGGAIIMTSEVSLLDKTQGFKGQVCRIMEFELDPFENKPSLAEQTRRFCFKNYGWATEPLISLLLDPYEHEKLVKKYRKFFRELEKQATFEITDVERRLLQRCALILVSGWLLCKAIQCNFNLLALEQYLLAHITSKVKARDDRDEADIIIDKISGFVCTNQDKFPTVEALSSKATRRHYGAFWGATGFHGTNACLWIEENVLGFRIIPHEMKRKNTTMQVLASKGYIVKFYGNRYTIKRDFGRVEAQYYCFLLPENPTLLRRIEDYSNAKLSVATLSAKLAEDHYKMNYENLNAERNIPYLAISHRANNSYAIFANEYFRKLMSMTLHSTLYATYLAGDEALLLTKDKAAVNSIPLRFEKENEGIVAKGISVINLQDKLEIPIPLGHRLVMAEISFEEYKGKPGAVVNVQKELLYIEPTENPPVDFTVQTFKDDGVQYRNVNSLLDDDHDEDN